MTLINYLNRVHFAENILEEAVWAELDQRRGATFLVVATGPTFTGELGERLMAGIPKQARTVTCPTDGGIPTEREAMRLAAQYREAGCDAILAFGRGYVINLAKALRLTVTHGTPLARFSEAEGGSVRITGPLPDLIAIPGLQGFGTGFNGLLSVLLNSGTMIEITGRNMVPTVTIGDPTIALKEPPVVVAGACVEAIALCVEALLSPNYNPPANGIAMDGLNRGLQSLKSVSHPAAPQAMRELMAACMNAALVQQKGLGLTHAITSALCATCGVALDKGQVKRLLLPGVLRYYEQNDALENSGLPDAMGLRTPAEAVAKLAGALQALPLPRSLTEMGVTADDVVRCVEKASHHRALADGPCRPSAHDIKGIVSAVL